MARISEYSYREKYFYIPGMRQRLNERHHSIKNSMRTLSPFKKEIARVQLQAIEAISGEINTRLDQKRIDEISFADYEKIAAVATRWELASRELILARAKARRMARNLAQANQELAKAHQSEAAGALAFKQGHAAGMQEALAIAKGKETPKQ